MTTKKTSCLVIILLVTTITNLYSMKRPLEEHVSDLVGNVLLNVENPNVFLHFTGLPKDTQNRIIQFASLYTTAKTLETAAHTVNSLAQVNRELNQKINDPIFCLLLIKHLAKRFHCTDYDACKALQTHAAKQRLEIQQKLYALCRNLEPLDFEGNPVSPQHHEDFLIDHYGPDSDNAIEAFLWDGYLLSGCKELPDNYDFEKDLDILHQQNVDLEFTYPLISTSSHDLYKDGLTPLMVSLTEHLQNKYSEHEDYVPQIASKTPEEELMKLIKIPSLLISQGADINGTNNSGNTALMLVAIEYNFNMLTFLCENYKQSIDLNKQNNWGYTVLMWIIIDTIYQPFYLISDDLPFYLEAINYLAQAGANPNITDNEGRTVLEHAENLPFFQEISAILLLALKGELTKKLYLKIVKLYEQKQEEKERL